MRIVVVEIIDVASARDHNRKYSSFHILFLMAYVATVKGKATLFIQHYPDTRLFRMLYKTA